MSPDAVSSVYALGAALLGLWLVCRYPSIGPRSLRGGFLLVACASAALFVCGDVTRAAETLAGPAVALTLVALPILVFAFWSAAHLLRLYMTLLGRLRG